MLAPNVMRPSNAVVLDPHARKRPKDKFSAVCISDPPAESILGQRTTPLIIRESCPHFPSQNAALKCVDALARLRGGVSAQTPRLRKQPHPTSLRQRYAPLHPSRRREGKTYHKRFAMRGSSASRRPSPSRFTASTVTERKMDGKNTM